MWGRVPGCSRVNAHMYIITQIPNDFALLINTQMRFSQTCFFCHAKKAPKTRPRGTCSAMSLFLRDVYLVLVATVPLSWRRFGDDAGVLLLELDRAWNRSRVSRGREALV